MDARSTLLVIALTMAVAGMPTKDPIHHPTKRILSADFGDVEKERQGVQLRALNAMDYAKEATKEAAKSAAEQEPVMMAGRAIYMRTKRSDAENMNVIDPDKLTLAEAAQEAEKAEQEVEQKTAYDGTQGAFAMAAESAGTTAQNAKKATSEAAAKAALEKANKAADAASEQAHAAYEGMQGSFAMAAEAADKTKTEEPASEEERVLLAGPAYSGRTKRTDSAEVKKKTIDAINEVNDATTKEAADKDPGTSELAEAFFRLLVLSDNDYTEATKEGHDPMKKVMEDAFEEVKKAREAAEDARCLEAQMEYERQQAAKETTPEPNLLAGHALSGRTKRSDTQGAVAMVEEAMEHHEHYDSPTNAADKPVKTSSVKKVASRTESAHLHHPYEGLQGSFAMAEEGMEHTEGIIADERSRGRTRRF